ncbi:hypothetical protein S58_60680 [Bradyrhizobium oligotrophicum S58]|uniref:Uncharacterized protein n=1 Tax=Bradyrhizobium oligotrophicum S58 TaxID=1245469 RepID=M4ZE54_9BRAD|nr:hypothetical protein [Bradyrhizobium oligotrophicum]BAM92044.1 hypothetical protein S58_60680 [Bradyrhizobium oligotrophicum S58]
MPSFLAVRGRQLASSPLALLNMGAKAAEQERRLLYEQQFVTIAPTTDAFAKVCPRIAQAPQ